MLQVVQFQSETGVYQELFGASKAIELLFDLGVEPLEEFWHGNKKGWTYGLDVIFQFEHVSTVEIDGTSGINTIHNQDPFETMRQR